MTDTETRRDVRRSERLPDALREPLRETWAKGPWDDEPDLVEWRHPYFPGLPLLAVRNAVGAWCGYVGVPPGHPWHGKDRDACDADAHGGLTYSDKCSGDICHVAAPGEPDDVWWLGFDCAHAGDVMPSVVAILAAKRLDTFGDVFGNDKYRDLAYVMDEVEGLAVQVRDAVKA